MVNARRIIMAIISATVAAVMMALVPVPANGGPPSTWMLLARSEANGQTAHFYRVPVGSNHIIRIAVLNYVPTDVPGRSGATTLSATCADFTIYLGHLFNVPFDALTYRRPNQSPDGYVGHQEQPGVWSVVQGLVPYEWVGFNPWIQRFAERHGCEVVRG